MLSKFLFILLIFTSFITGCSGLSDEDKARIADAEENLEDIALAPKITTPSEDEEIKGLVDVYVDVDTNYLDRYSKVTLFIEGRPELEDDEFPYEFTFNSYFWSDDERISLLAKVETLKGNELRSEVVSVPLATDANRVISFDTGVDGRELRSITQTSVSWGAVSGALNYELQINNKQPVSTSETNAVVPLQELGEYTIKVRAIDEKERAGPWSDTASLNLLTPERPLISTPINFLEYRSINSLQASWDHSEDGLSFEYQIDEEEIQSISEQSVVLENLALGGHSFRVRAIDPLGHSSPWDQAFFSISEPVAPEIQSPSVSGNYRDLQSLEASWIYEGEGITFEYQLNNQPIVHTENKQASLSGLVPGNQVFQVRAVDSLGYRSSWSDVTFNLKAPVAPVISSMEETDTDTAFQLNVVLDSIYPQTIVEISRDSSFSPNSILEISSSGLTHEIELPLGTYYVRAKAKNEFGHESSWSSSQEVSLGLFAVAINMSHGGWNDYDNPSQLLIDENRLLVMTNNGPTVGDASGSSSLYITKTDTNGNKDWGKSLFNHAQSLHSISISEDVYLATARAKDSWLSGKIFQLSKSSGNIINSYIFESDDSVDGNPNIYTTEQLYNSAQLSGGEIAVLKEQRIIEITDQGSYSQLSKKNTLEVLNLDLNPPVINSHELPISTTGEYTNISKLLVDEDKLFAVGLYKSNSGDASDDYGVPSLSASGAVVFEVSKADGSIHQAGTEIIPGIGGAYSFDAELSVDGSMHVAYDSYYSSPVSSIDATRQLKDFYSNTSIRYGKIALDKKNNSYLVGESVNSYTSSSVSKYKNGIFLGSKSLNLYSRDLTIKDVIFDKRYGVVIIGTDKGKFSNASYSDTYTVIFNITEDLDYLAPSKLIFDYGY